MNPHRPFPEPFVITISVPKGGDKKTWTALNLASVLGLWGYDVLAVDTNSQHDMWADVQHLAKRGITPRFDVVMHDPVDEQGDQNPLPDFGAYAGRQFVVYDTCQFLQFRVSKYAWKHCHAMILTASPQMAEVRAFQSGLQYYQQLTDGAGGPFLVLPCGVPVLKNSATQQAFEDLLRFLEQQGAHIPKVGGRYFSQRELIPHSDLMSFQHTRWIFDERAQGRRLKAVSDDFIQRVLLHFLWIRRTLEAHYGPFPPPRWEPLLDARTALGSALDRDRLRALLEEEFRTGVRRRLAQEGALA